MKLSRDLIFNKTIESEKTFLMTIHCNTDYNANNFNKTIKSDEILFEH